jgi:hypothetical protein
LNSSACMGVDLCHICFPYCLHLSKQDQLWIHGWLLILWWCPPASFSSKKVPLQYDEVIYVDAVLQAWFCWFFGAYHSPSSVGEHNFSTGSKPQPCSSYFPTAIHSLPQVFSERCSFAVIYYTTPRIS